MNLLDLPPEICIEILLFAAYSSVDFACNLAVVSSWTNKLAQQALLSAVSVIHTDRLLSFFKCLGLVKGPFPRRIPVGNLFRLSFRQIPELNPTHDARHRVRLLRNLWLIPIGVQQTRMEDHVYTRLLLQLCTNIQNLALTGTAFSHFLVNKSEHFRDVTDADGADIEQSPYPCLTHLTLLDSTPTLIMERHYRRAEEYVRLFKQLTHFTTYGFYHRNGLPVPIQYFPSLTHVALPLILNPPQIEEEEIDEVQITTAEIYHMTGGWKLLQSTQQIQMLVFLFPSTGRISRGSHLADLFIPHPPTNLILEANRLDRRAYALPIDGLSELHRQWYGETRGGPSIWDLARNTLESYHRAFGPFGVS